VQRGAPLIRDRFKGGVCNGPGSAAHHFVLRCARDTTNYAHATSPPGREALRDCRLIPISHCQTATSRAPGKTHRPAPASNRNSPFPLRLAHCAPGPNLFFHQPPPRGRRSADRRVFLVVGPRGLCAARTLRSVRSPLGAPPWRFLVPGSPRVPSGSAGPVAQASPHQPLWPGRRCRASEAAVANLRSRTPHPLRHQDRLRRRPSSSGILHTSLDAIRSQYISSNCAEKTDGGGHTLRSDLALPRPPAAARRTSE
jgi:hypothetical protein